MMRLRLLLCLGVVVCLSQIGCKWLVMDDGKNEEQSKIKIGLAMDSLREERWRRDRDYLEMRIKQLGGELIVQNSNNSHRQQLKQVKYLLKQKIKVLIIIPQDLKYAREAVVLAHRAGVKVISYDRLIRDVKLDFYVSFDNLKVGELMAEYLVNKVPQGNYVIINGAPNDNNCYLFNQGYKNVLNPYIKEGKIKVLFEAWTNDWQPKLAYQYIQNLLNQKKEFQAVIAGNDNLASAVIEALSEWRLAGKVYVVGHDADLSGCQRIVEKTQLMTVYKPIRQLAYRAADLAMDLAVGKEPKENHPKINNGKYLIPTEIIKPIPIDENNIDFIIKDGFHSKEEIYLNIPNDFSRNSK